MEQPQQLQQPPNQKEIYNQAKKEGIKRKRLQDNKLKISTKKPRKLDFDEDDNKDDSEVYDNGEIKNLCQGCGIDMGESNPRYYCGKTMCPIVEHDLE